MSKQISALTSIASPAATALPQPGPSATPSADRATGHRSGALDIARSLPWVIWGAGVFVGLIVLLAGLVRLARVVSASVPMPNGPWRRLAASISTEYGLKSVVHLLESRNPSVLITSGVMSPRVVLPAGSAEWSEERARIVLRHELAHIRRGDWIVHMIAQTLRVACWFNPLVWIVCRRLRLESECACDDSVLSGDIKGHDYAEHLLDLARVLNRPGQSWSAALTMARPSTIERRFSAMLNPGLNRHPVSRSALFSMVFVALAITLSLSAAGRPAPAQVEPSATGPRQQISTREFVAEVRQNFQSGRSSERRRSSALDRALFEVAEQGDFSEIDGLLRAGANVNAVIVGDGTPLMAAAGDGHLEAVRLLLDRGADPNIPVPGDGTALIVAARGGHMDVVQLLLDRGADPNGAVLGDGNPLIMAAREGHLNIVTLLLDRGANIDQIVPGDENALIGASAEGHLNMVGLLVSRHADVNARIWIEPNPWRPIGEWRTALSEARRKGHQDVVQFLISVGAKD